MTRIFSHTVALMTALLITTATFAEAIRVPADQGALITSHLA
jgi:hypothetical protein